MTREEAIEVLKDCELNPCVPKDKEAVNMAIKALEQEPRKGHWIKVGDRGFGYSDIVICKCSECEEQKEFTGKFDGHSLIVDMERADNYCSNCGADMREVEDE